MQAKTPLLFDVKRELSHFASPVLSIWQYFIYNSSKVFSCGAHWKIDLLCSSRLYGWVAEWLARKLHNHEVSGSIPAHGILGIMPANLFLGSTNTMWGKLVDSVTLSQLVHIILAIGTWHSFLVCTFQLCLEWSGMPSGMPEISIDCSTLSRCISTLSSEWNIIEYLPRYVTLCRSMTFL